MSTNAKPKPKVSVILPFFNAARYLRQCLLSVLAQDFASFEVIAIDDESTDESNKLIRQWQPTITILSQKNAGPAAARNRGVRAAQADLIAFIDADDMWTQRKLSRQIQIMVEKPEVKIVLGKTQCFATTSETVSREECASRQSPPFHTYLFGASMARRDVFDRIGFCNESMRTGEDVDWFLRAREAKIPIELHDDVALMYRRHVESITAERQNGKDGLLLSLKASLDRRRMPNIGSLAELARGGSKVL